MDQHPVPQNITSYEFRLVGDMTLKQFLQLAGGAAVGFIWYQLPLPFIIKWPLILASVGIGVLLAFIPVQGRPFSQWLLAFIQAVYAPTEYYWKPRSGSELIVDGSEKNGPTSMNPEPRTMNIVDKLESQFFNKVNQLFVSLNITRSTPIPDPVTVTETFPEETNQVAYSFPVHETTTEPLPTVIPTSPVSAAMPAVSTDLVPDPQGPNLLTGLAQDETGKIAEGVIVEIIEQGTGIPARALRTNKLGQFSIASPLTVGKYIIHSEKDGLVFDPISIEINGTVIKPILLKAK